MEKRKVFFVTKGGSKFWTQISAQNVFDFFDTLCEYEREFECEYIGITLL